MGSTTNRNIANGSIMQIHGLLQDIVYWVDYDTQNVVQGTLAELGEECDRPERVPSPSGIDFKYHLDRETGTKVMKWCPNGSEIVAFEFNDRQEALAKLEDIWRSEIYGYDDAPFPHRNGEEAYAELAEWQEDNCLV